MGYHGDIFMIDIIIKKIIFSHRQILILKWMSLLFLLVGYFRFLFASHFLLLQSISSLAYPLISFLIAYNYLFYNNNIKQLKKLLIFGLISQFPYLFIATELNMLFTLALGVLIIHSLANKYYLLFILASLMTISSYPYLEYNLWGILLPVSFYFALKFPYMLPNVILCITALYTYPINLIALISLPLIYIIHWLPMYQPIRLKQNLCFYYSYSLILIFIGVFLFIKQTLWGIYSKIYYFI